MTFLTVSSFYSIFTQVPKTFKSTVALQVGFSKHLGDVATVLLDLGRLSLFCFFMSFQTDYLSIFNTTAKNYMLMDFRLYFKS